MPPQLVLLAGANGSGKSTVAGHLLPSDYPFLNADEIAKGLPDAPSTGRDIQAGRTLFREWDRLVERKRDLAVETTLASRSLAPRIARLQEQGYEFHLIYIWLPNVDLAIARVAERVRQGGHDIPVAIIRRRYWAGLHNLVALYQPIADTWRIFDNVKLGVPQFVASGGRHRRTHIYRSEAWEQILEGGGYAGQ